MSVHSFSHSAVLSVHQGRPPHLLENEKKTTTPKLQQVDVEITSRVKKRVKFFSGGQQPHQHLNNQTQDHRNSRSLLRLRGVSLVRGLTLSSRVGVSCQLHYQAGDSSMLSSHGPAS